MAGTLALQEVQGTPATVPSPQSTKAAAEASCRAHLIASAGA